MSLRSDDSVFSSLQQVTGATYDNAEYNKDLIDVYLLRKARQKGLRLPTGGPPAEYKYLGAWVEPSTAGTNENVVYIDVSSMYPSFIMTLNASPETIIGDRQALRESEYTEDDCVWGYIDTRPVKHLEKGEPWAQYTDGVSSSGTDSNGGSAQRTAEGQYKMVYDPHAPSKKWSCDEGAGPRYEKCYFLGHDVQKGFLTECVEELIDLKNQYRGTPLYGSTKTVTNCFTADTEVMTPNGVRNIRDLDVGDEVYSFNTDTDEVEVKPVTETFAYPDYDGELVDIQTQHTDFSVTPNHRMCVRKDNPSPKSATWDEYDFIEAGDLESYSHYELPHNWDVEHGESLESVDITEYLNEYVVWVNPAVHGRTFQGNIDWCGEQQRVGGRDDWMDGYRLTKEDFEQHREYVEDVAEEIYVHAAPKHKWIPKDYDGDNFLQLLAWFITEGSARVSGGDKEKYDTKRGKTHQINIAQEGGGEHTKIENLLDEMGLEPYVDDRGFSLSSKLLYTTLRDLCGTDSFEKQIPEFVFSLSERQKRLFFQTLIDGDGDSREGSHRYTTSSDTLRDDFMRLCVHLGRNPRYSHDSSSWRIFYGETKNSFRPHRSAETRQSADDEGVYCVEVEDNHTLLAGRNGNFQFVGQSIYGVLGFANADSSFRLFDWRIAEAITLSGRKMIQFSRDYVVDYLNERGYEAYPALGDSVPANEPVVIRNEDGDVNIVQIENLEGRDGDVEVWSDKGFTKVKDVIKKPNRKTIYQTRTLNGVVNVTEDHSLVRSDGSEVSPEDVEEGDELLHRDTGEALPQTNTRTFNHGIPWVLGLFTAEGTCNEYERDNGTLRYPWSIVNQDKALLEHAAQILEEQWGVSTVINDTRKSSSCWKLQLKGNNRGHQKWIAMDFRDMCYDGDDKCVPIEVLNGAEEERREFLHGFHAGDGHIQDIDGRERDFDEFMTASKPLATGVSMLLKSFGWDTTIDTRKNYDNYYYRVRAVEGSKYHNSNREAVRDNGVVEYDGDHVYDLETENHHFHAGVGDIIVHNTDGVGISVPSAATRHEAMELVEDAVESLNGEGYDTFFREDFGVPPEQHHGEIEIESFSPKVFIPSRHPPHGDVGVKKRRIQWDTWNDDDGEIDEISITGLEAERSDVAPVTKQVQRLFAEAIRQTDSTARGDLFPTLREYADAIENGNIALDRVCKRGGIGQNLHEYGTASRTPAPLYRGAKYATDTIDGCTIQHGDKPRLVYVTSVGEGMDTTYTAQTAEDGEPVDAIAVNDVARLPAGVTVDWDRHLQKVLLDPMQPLLDTRFGGDAWSEIIHSHKQTGLRSY